MVIDQIKICIYVTLAAANFRASSPYKLSTPLSSVDYCVLFQQKFTTLFDQK